MQNLFGGIALGIALGLIGDLIIWTAYESKSKRIKAQEFAYHQFFLADCLWYKDPITFNYKGHDVTVQVKQNVFTGTKNNCKLHKLFINDKECATIIKTNDTVKSYFAAYVNEQFIEEEVWDILDKAYVASRIEKTIKKETVLKKSVIYNETND